MGVLAIFSTGIFAIIGTAFVESETCSEKDHEIFSPNSQKCTAQLYDRARFFAIFLCFK